MDKRFQDRLKYLLKVEEDKTKRRKKEAEKQKDIYKEKKRTMEKEYTGHSDDEEALLMKDPATVNSSSLKRRIEILQAKKEQRKKFRKKEYEDDQQERRKEILDKIAPPSMEDILPKEMDYPNKEKQLGYGDKLNTNADFFLDNMKVLDSKNSSSKNVADSSASKMDEEKLAPKASLNSNFSLEDIKMSMEMNGPRDIKKSASQWNDLNISSSSMDTEKIDSSLLNINIKSIESNNNVASIGKPDNFNDEEEDTGKYEDTKYKRPKVPQEHLNKVLNNDIVIKDEKSEKNEGSDKKEKTDDQLIEEKRSEMIKLMKKIPKKKKEIFAFEVDWDLVQKCDIVEGKMHPWLKKKSMDQFGNEERVFIDLIQKKLKYREKPDEVAKRLEKVLDEDSMKFVADMWRTLIFEILKAKKFH